MLIKKGDIFAIPISTERISLGQVAWRRGQAYLLVVFEGLYPTEPLPDLDAAIEGPIRLQTLTFDALIHSGRWPIIGHRPVAAGRIATPEYKVMTRPDEYSVTDFSGKIIRPARQGDIDKLPSLTYVSPVRLEHAAQALAGLGPWTDAYMGLLPPIDGMPLSTVDPRGQ
jgi:hypothetical protein